jgi:flagellar protein FlbD
MIILNRIDGSNIVVNNDEIEFIESTHDTTLSMKSGRKIIVTQSPDDIIELVIKFRQQCNVLPSIISDKNLQIIDGE